MPDAATSNRTRRGAIGMITVALALTLAVTVVGWHLTASREFGLSGSGPIPQRTSAARRASRMEPWNASFAARVRVLTWWAEGQQLLDSGDYNGAVEVLARAYRDDVGDAELLALFKQAQAVQSAETVRKAHLQHGHEGPGGTLTPEQIER